MQTEQFPETETRQESENLARVRGASVEELGSMDFYERLGVNRDATKEEIQAAFKEIAPGLHPDSPGTSAEDEERLKLITEARAELKDPQKRSAYDLRNPPREQRQDGEQEQATDEASRATAERDGMAEFMRYAQESTARWEAERAAANERVRRENEAFWKKYDAERAAEEEKLRARRERERQEEEREKREQEKRKAENAAEAERILTQYEADFSALLDASELKIAGVRAELEQLRKDQAALEAEWDGAFVHAVGVNWSELLRPQKTDERKREFRKQEEALRERRWALHNSCQSLLAGIRSFVDQSEKMTMRWYSKPDWKSELFMDLRYKDSSPFFDEEDHSRLAEEYKKMQTSVGGRRIDIEREIRTLESSIGDRS